MSAKMSTSQTTTKTTALKQNVVKPSRLRRFLTAIFALLFLFFASISILAFWAERTITDSQQFSAIVGPLASAPEVQKFISREVADAVIENSNPQDLASGLLGLPPGSVLTPQVQNQIEAKIEASTTKIIASEQFQKLWQNGTAKMHSQTINLLAKDDGAQLAVMDVRPELQELFNLVNNSELKLGQKLELEPGSGELKFKTEQLASLRQAYQLFTQVDLVAILAAILSAGLAILIIGPGNRLKITRRLAIGLAISTGLSALFIVIATRVSFYPDDTLQSAFAAVIADSLLEGLKNLSLIIFGVSALVVLAVSLILHKNRLLSLKK